MEEKEILCPDCGKPLKKAFELSEQEKQELIQLNSKENDLNNQLNTVALMSIDKQLKKVIKKIFIKKANAFIEKQEFINRLSKKYNCYISYQIIEGIAYIHN